MSAAGPESKELLVVKVMDGLATDYFMTSWDPDFFRWPWKKEILGDLLLLVTLKIP